MKMPHASYVVAIAVFACPARAVLSVAHLCITCVSLNMTLHERAPVSHGPLFASLCIALISGVNRTIKPVTCKHVLPSAVWLTSRTGHDVLQ